MTIPDKSANPTPKSPPKNPLKAKSSGAGEGAKEELCTLVLQGGGALGEFWDGVSSYLKFIDLLKGLGNQAREMLNESRAAMVSLAMVSLFGVPGFFTPRIAPAPMHMPGTMGTLSYYDTTPLQHTLEKLIDFDLLNTQDPRHKVRLSVGAVNLTTGNFRYFDSAAQGKDGLIGPHHIMASGALPPRFPPVEIDGEFYWDGGLVLQVDLFSARGRMPRSRADQLGKSAMGCAQQGRQRASMCWT